MVYYFYKVSLQIISISGGKITFLGMLYYLDYITMDVF